MNNIYWLTRKNQDLILDCEQYIVVNHKDLSIYLYMKLVMAFVRNSKGFLP